MENRFMIVRYIKKPNGNWDEITEFSKKIKNSHIDTAKVILDLKDKKCVINSINREATFDDMLEFYKKLLGDQLTPYLPQD